MSSQSLTDSRDLWWSDIESKFLDLQLRELSSQRRRIGRGPCSEGHGQDGVHMQSFSRSISVLLFLSLQEASDSTCLSPVAPVDLTRLPRCYRGRPSQGRPCLTVLVDLPDVVIPHTKLCCSQNTSSPRSHHDCSKNACVQPSVQGESRAMITQRTLAITLG